MRFDISADPVTMSAHAAARFAQLARTHVAMLGGFTVALSGGATPLRMFDELAGDHEVPWARVHVFQVDDHIPDGGGPGVNFAELSDHLLDRVPIPASNVHPMPIGAVDLEAARHDYAEELRAVCGRPPQLDLVHLGLAHDGHVASLYPREDEATALRDDVVVVADVRGERRMSLTLATIARARNLLWLVAGADKSGVLRRWRDGQLVPASHVPTDRAVLVTDRAAAAVEG